MPFVIYKEKDFPFNDDFSYIIKDKEGKEVTHTLHVQLTEEQLDKFDMTDKKMQDAMEQLDANNIARMILTPEQIKELKGHVNNDYQFKMIVTNMAGYIMGFIQGQRIESSTSAMSSNPVMKKYNKYVSAVRNSR